MLNLFTPSGFRHVAMLLSGSCLVLGANIAAMLAVATLVKGHHRHKRCWSCQQAHRCTAVEQQEARQ